MRLKMVIFLLSLALLFPFCAQLKDGPLSHEERVELDSAKRDLKSSDPDIVYYAVCNLLRMSHKAALEVLKENFEKGPPIVKLKVIKALGDKSDRVSDSIKDYIVLLKAALSEEDETIRKQLTQTFIALKSPAVTSFIAGEVKARPQDSKLLKMAVDSFSSMRLDDMEMLGHLIEVGSVVSDTDMRNRLLKALNDALQFEEFKSFVEAKEWYEKNKGKSYDDVMREQIQKIRSKLDKLREENETLRKRYITERIKNVTSLPEDKRVPEVLRLLEEKDSPAELREFAICELGALKAKEHYEKLMPFLSSAEDRLCILSLEALRQMGAKEAASPISELVKSRSADVRLSAVKALTSLAVPSPVLIEQLQVENDVRVLEALVEAVDSMKMTDALNILLTKMFVTNEGGLLQVDGKFGTDVRRKTIIAVGRLALTADEPLKKKAIEVLIASLNDSDASVRFYSCERLGALRATISQAPLVLRLKDDKSPGVRAAAARALGSISEANEETINALMDALTSNEKEIVEAAIEALRTQCGIAEGQSKGNLKLLRNLVTEMMSKKMFEVVVSLLRFSKERLAGMEKEDAATFASILLESARAYEQSGDLRKASAVYETIIGFLQGKDAIDGRGEFARLLVKQSMFAEALAQYDALLSLAPERQTEFWHKKLDIVEAVADKDEKTAKQMVEGFVKAASQDKFPQEIKERLAKVAKKLSVEYNPPPTPPVPPPTPPK